MGDDLNDQETTYMVFIAADEYKDQQWRDLKNPEKDAADVKDCLEQRFGFVTNRELIGNAVSRASIYNLLDECIKESKEKDWKNDRCIVYYAGHGYLSDGGYLAPPDSTGTITGTMISHADVMRKIEAIEAKHVLLILDCCYSGDLFQTFRGGNVAGLELENLEKFHSRWVITSGQTEVVCDGFAGKNSPFASELISFVSDQDQSFAASSLLTHLASTVPQLTSTQQQPDGGAIFYKSSRQKYTGQFVFRPKTQTNKRLEELKAILKETPDDIVAIREILSSYPDFEDYEDFVRLEQKLGRGQFNVFKKDLEIQLDHFANFWPRYQNWVFQMQRALDGDFSSAKVAPNTNSIFPDPLFPVRASSVKNKKQKAYRYTETINGVSFEMVKIPAGKFIMGSPFLETGRYDNEPQQEVITPRFFYMGVHPVTFDLYDQFILETKHERPEDQDWGRGNRPVINVSWEDAQDFCLWLSKKTGKKYRLPTEAEWEYACRAETNTPFNTGFNLTTQQANYNGDHPYNLNKKGKNRGQTLPVCSFPQNDWGLYDMHGNVWEWCNDMYKDRNRVYRGGSWSNSANCCRSAIRYDGGPTYRDYDLGFRLVSQ
jgi:formylglycine-generating enzyme